MATKLFQSLLKRFHVPFKGRKKAGFTLTELLVTILISGFVITALLSFVVNLIETDRREYSRSETQRDMQTALDFIADDLREAVYVYDRVEKARDGAPALKDYLPDFGGNVRPVLAFWKAERIPDDKLPSSCGATDDECNQVLIRRRTYSLVVYLQAKNQTEDEKKKWKGESRIMRYVLSKYNNLPNLSSKSTGYADPEETGFASWPLGVTGWSKPSVPKGGAPVLVDFVDNPENTENELGKPLKIERCTSTDDKSPLYTKSGDQVTYRRVPHAETSKENNSTSFFVCVKTLGTVAGTNQEESANQDVVISLRGNPVGRINQIKEPLVTLSTQAVARGVIDKKPQ